MWTRHLAKLGGSVRRLSTTAHFYRRASDQTTTAKCAVLTLALVTAAGAIQNNNNHSKTSQAEESKDDDDDTTTLLLNWSGTHAVQVRNDHFWEPETVTQVEEIVRECHRRGQAVRPLGSALSPNGIAFHAAGMMSLANLDKIVSVDAANSTVTVQAGARVSQVIDALRPYQLTLPNLASIAEQQMGGFVQIGAHGTGRTIAPVDHYVTKLKLVTPGKGTIELTKEKDGQLFQLAKVAMGCLGVVVEITMECVPAHNLVEQTFVLTREEARSQLDKLLKDYKHMRYMWIPYADAVVVVTNQPESEYETLPDTTFSMTEEERFQPLTDLLTEVSKDSPEFFTKESIKGMGFGEIRDALLAVDPLDINHVKRCNQAEAEFWRRSQGCQIKPSDELLQFDCGGQVRSFNLRAWNSTRFSNTHSHDFSAMGLGSMLSYRYTRA